MKSLTLKNFELFDLQAEIAHVIENCTSFTAKYHLNNLLAQVEPKAKNFVELKNELIKKYGSEDEKGEISVKQYKSDEGKEAGEESESYVEFMKEFNELIGAETEVEYSPLKLSVFDTVNSDKFYKQLFKFIKE